MRPVCSVPNPWDAAKRVHARIGPTIPGDHLIRQGQVLAGRYRVAEKLGAGGYGTVYRAQDRSTKRTVAVKVLRPDLAADPDYVRRFQREADIARSLDSQHIVRVLDVVQGKLRGEDVHYQIMEYVEGSTLHNEMQQRGRLTVGETATLAIQLCSALQEAHSRGVVHGDVKPKNIFIGTDGVVRLSDFGVARAEDYPTLSQSDPIFATPRYMSPEQAAGDRDIDIRSDIYSLGVVLYEALAGQPPFEGSSPGVIAAKHMREAPPPLAEKVPELPPEVECVVTKCLAKEPGDRFQAPSELAEALGSLEGINPATAGITISRTRRRFGLRLTPRRRPAIAWTMAVLVGVVALAAMLVVPATLGAFRLGAGDGGANPTLEPAPLVAITSATHITYVDEDGDVAVINHEGIGATKLTTDGNNHSPQWSPDGTQIAFLHTVREDPLGVECRRVEILGIDEDERRVMEPDIAGDPNVLPGPCAESSNLRWGPDGCDLYVHLTSEPTGQHLIRRVPLCGAEPWDEPFAPFFDIRGDGSFARISQSNTGDNPQQHLLQIGPVKDEDPYSAAIDGNGPVSWSPDGRMLAITTGQSIALVDTQGVAVDSFPFPGGGKSESYDFSLDWSPDGSRVVLEGESGLIVLDVGSGESAFLVEGTEPAWFTPKVAVVGIVEPDCATLQAPALGNGDDPALRLLAPLDGAVTGVTPTFCWMSDIDPSCLALVIGKGGAESESTPPNYVIELSVPARPPWLLYDDHPEQLADGRWRYRAGEFSFEGGYSNGESAYPTLVLPAGSYEWSITSDCESVSVGPQRFTVQDLVLNQIEPELEASRAKGFTVIDATSFTESDGSVYALVAMYGERADEASYEHRSLIQAYRIDDTGARLVWEDSFDGRTTLRIDKALTGKDITGAGYRGLVVRVLEHIEFCSTCESLRILQVAGDSVTEIPVRLPEVVGPGGNVTRAFFDRLENLQTSGGQPDQTYEIVALDPNWGTLGLESCLTCGDGPLLPSFATGATTSPRLGFPIRVLAYSDGEYVDNTSAFPEFVISEAEGLEAALDEFQTVDQAGWPGYPLRSPCWSDTVLITEAIVILVNYARAGQAERGWISYRELTAMDNLKTPYWKLHIEDVSRWLEFAIHTDRIIEPRSGAEGWSLKNCEDAGIELVATVQLGFTPGVMALNEATGRLYLAKSAVQEIVVIEARSREIIGTVPVGGYVSEIAVNEATNRVYVGVTPGSDLGKLVVLDGGLNSVVSEVPMVSRVRGIAVDVDANRIFVTQDNSPKILIVDGQANAIAGELGEDILADTGCGGRAIYQPQTQTIYAVAETVCAVDTIAESVTRFPRDDCCGLASPSAGPSNVVYIGSTNGLFCIENGQIERTSVSDPVWALDYDSTRSRLYVGLPDGRMLVFDTDTKSVIFEWEHPSSTSMNGLLVDSKTGLIYTGRTNELWFLVDLLRGDS